MIRTMNNLNYETNNPIKLAQDLIKLPSVTPLDEGAIELLSSVLKTLGFVCHIKKFSSPNTDEVTNLYARLGDQNPNFCFAGHTDVVPSGPSESWDSDPFSGHISDGNLYGRGAADMKSAIAAFVCAVGCITELYGPPSKWEFPGSISLLITGDEEGPAINGTRKLLEWLEKKEEVISTCIVGEPTNESVLGDMVKIGRRGSLNGTLKVNGIQGHTAYPHLAQNPVHHLIYILQSLIYEPLDQGTEHFQASTFQISNIDVGNRATNVIPASAIAHFNIRFNDLHTSESIRKLLVKRITATIDEEKVDYELDIHVSGECFLTPPGTLSNILISSIEEVTGKTPTLSTTGGTSDARFIKNYCPVAEFGLVGKTMHKANENVLCSDVDALSRIYFSVIKKYFQFEDSSD